MNVYVAVMDACKEVRSLSPPELANVAGNRRTEVAAHSFFFSAKT